MLRSNAKQHAARVACAGYIRQRPRCGGADADLSHIPIGDCATANELREPSILNFGAFQPAHDSPGAWLKWGSAPTHPWPAGDVESTADPLQLRSAAARDN